MMPLVATPSSTKIYEAAAATRIEKTAQASVKEQKHKRPRRAAALETSIGTKKQKLNAQWTRITYGPPFALRRLGASWHALQVGAVAQHRDRVKIPFESLPANSSLCAALQKRYRWKQLGASGGLSEETRRIATRGIGGSKYNKCLRWSKTAKRSCADGIFSVIGCAPSFFPRGVFREFERSHVGKIIQGYFHELFLAVIHKINDVINNHESFRKESRWVPAWLIAYEVCTRHTEPVVTRHYEEQFASLKVHSISVESKFIVEAGGCDVSRRCSLLDGNPCPKKASKQRQQ
eukprot:GHVT01087160.1.p1 GENE.GHVT01087160.1~~GHVT01087160.1.p1  ORF type:complete len:291 (-),score=10.43 GHVT01087160.1:2093-2965(-)